MLSLLSETRIGRLVGPVQVEQFLESPVNDELARVITHRLNADDRIGAHFVCQSLMLQLRQTKRNDDRVFFFRLGHNLQENVYTS